MHDWTRVSSGTFHDFHNGWITHLKEALNGEVLPDFYYAQSEQMAGDIRPDVLTLHSEDAVEEDAGEFEVADGRMSNCLAVDEQPPRTRIVQQADGDADFYLTKRRTLVIRHASGDRVVAVIEIVSPANKHQRDSLAAFVDKVIATLRAGIHVVIVDPFPPGRQDPEGMHGAVWNRLTGQAFEPPDQLPLTLASYRASLPVTAWVEPFAVGHPLASMPLFLNSSHYVPLPLESTYLLAWSGVPRRWQTVIAG